MSTPTPSIPTRDARILLAVEDDVSADLLAHRLSRRDLDSVRVVHGGKAKTKLQQTRFDLVVIETRLPGLTGLELLRQVPTTSVVGTPPVVLLGRSGNDEEIVQAFKLGAADFITRPFSPEVALARITRFLSADSTSESNLLSAGGSFLFPLSLLSTGDVGLFGFMTGLTVALFLLAVAFALIASVAHVGSRLRDRTHRRLTSSWRPRLLDVLAGDAPPSHLTDHVPPSQERAFLRFLIPFAARTKGRDRALVTELALPFLPNVEEMLDHTNPGLRAQAVQLFGLLGDASCRGILRRRLDDPSPLVTYTAFRWLSRRGTPADLPLLVSQLDRLSSVDVNQLSSSLVHVGEDGAPLLRSRLGDDDQSTFVRVVCAETLRWMGDGDAAAPAAQILGAHPPSELAAALLRLLRRVGCPKHAVLIRSYCDSNIPFVRIHAARALGQIGHPDQDRSLLRDLVTDAESRWVAFNAAKSLTELGQTRPLLSLSQSPHARASLAESVLKEPQA